MERVIQQIKKLAAEKAHTVVFAYRFLKCDILKKITFIVHK